MTASSPSAAGPIPAWHGDPRDEDGMAQGHAPICRHLIELMPERDLTVRAVLDFGCNQGGFLRCLHAIRPFRRALGVDIAEQSIATANALKPNTPSAGVPAANRLRMHGSGLAPEKRTS